ncbi:angiotensinogen [Microcaecilia unicolor]|uniref:Angiotensinogen n=1 Tax=Microcaecilia unicolor TaxID=1415580 RepID=A0A6P7XGJ3_9AMPH|nr:angiotensinogen [Microcaecilia unicolor]XP_030052297.1 angiotensinogen [Microcaecilia unicolor]
MTPNMILLYLTTCVILTAANRVYVHPFHFFAYNKSICDEMERQNQSTQEEKVFIPISLETSVSPDEENMKGTSSLDTESLNVKDLPSLTFLTELVQDVGFRHFNVLRKSHKCETALLSPITIYATLVSFYLGASKQTSDNLQVFLGFTTPSDCTSRVDGHKVLSALKTINGLLLSKDVDTSMKTFLFTAPGIYISEAFVHDLAPSSDALYVRSIDFTNSARARELINAFFEARTFRRSNNILTSVNPSTTTLLFASYIYFKVKVKNAFQVNEPQDFWIDSDKKISVPMISVTSMFHYDSDEKENLSVIRIPLSKHDILLLVQPIHGNKLERIESTLSRDSFQSWWSKPSKRYINLTMPKLMIKMSYDLQEILRDINLSTLLGENADFSKISDTHLKVGKVINQIHFELDGSGSEIEQPQNASEQTADTVPLEIKVKKPFLVAVFEGTSKALLFFGRVINPLSAF